jgi:hypothetical protein
MKKTLTAFLVIILSSVGLKAFASTLDVYVVKKVDKTYDDDKASGNRTVQNLKKRNDN